MDVTGRGRHVTLLDIQRSSSCLLKKYWLIGFAFVAVVGLGAKHY